MKDAAAVLGADLEQRQFPDLLGPLDEIRTRWDEDAARRGVPTLRQRLAEILDSESIDTVVAFDPRHGSSGHPAHRALGELVTEVLEAPSRSHVRHWALATVVTFDNGRFSFGPFEDDDPENRYFLSSGERYGDRWQHLLDVVSAHPSQVDDARILALREVSKEQRFVVLRPGRGLTGSARP